MKHVVKVILLLLNLLWGLLLVIGSYSAYFPSRIGTLVELLFPLNLFACIAFFFIWLEMLGAFQLYMGSARRTGHLLGRNSPILSGT